MSTRAHGRVALVAGTALALAGCGGGSSNAGPPPASTTSSANRLVASTVTSSTTSHRPAPPPYPRLLPGATRSGPTGFVPAVSWKGRTVAWVARSGSGVTLLSFDQPALALRLHSGTVDAGSGVGPWGPEIAHSERRHVVAAFNGGFKLNVGAGGFMAGGHIAVPLRAGLGSIVTYTDGTTDIGSWRHEVPAPGHQVTSVRQNLTLLIDHGRAAAGAGCVGCWGATLGGVSAPARSAVGITADGHLIWAGGEQLTPGELAQAMLEARVVRAVELDINPEWVAAYLYGHRGGHGPVAPVPMVAGQHGVPGQFLVPYTRDFFTIVAR